MSKGGSSTSKVEYPDWITDPAKRNIQRGEDLARLGDIPYMGPDVAALTPRQQASMASTDSALSAYGMPVSSPNFNSNMPVVNSEVGSNMPTGMPAPQNYGGIPAYSSYDIYQGAVDAFREARPGQAAARDDFFIDPVTGQMPTPPDQGLPVQPGPIQGGPVQQESSRPSMTEQNYDTMVRGNSYGGNYQAPAPNAGGGGIGGYQSFNDMFDGGGPGMQGNFYDNDNDPTNRVGGIARASNIISQNSNANSGVSASDSGQKSTNPDKCVVATHAVASGAFTPKTKRRAVVWCVKALHGKWWGEAIRRGYQTLGKRKIEQGKAHKHYTEFRNYIDFATGENRTLVGSIKFAARTAQFFAVGIFVGGR